MSSVAASPKRQILKTPEIIAALSYRYKAPEYALLTEVRNRTGFKRFEK